MDFISNLHQSFTLPEKNLSLPHVASLYSTNDYRALTIEKDFDANFSALMESCIHEVTSNTFDNHDAEFFLGNEVNLLKYSQSSPCLENSTKYQSCVPYCKWHDAYFKELPKEEFIAMMKYAVAQRKLILPPTQFEQNLSKRMFGNSSEGKLKHHFAPFALLLFCYKRNKGLVGDDFGIFAKACNDFFPTPTDQGVCLTQHMDIKEVMKTDKKYEALFEPNLQQPPELVKRGTDGSKHTLVFFTGIKWISRI